MDKLSVNRISLSVLEKLMIQASFCIREAGKEVLHISVSPKTVPLEHSILANHKNVITQKEKKSTKITPFLTLSTIRSVLSIVLLREYPAGRMKTMDPILYYSCIIFQLCFPNQLRRVPSFLSPQPVLSKYLGVQPLQSSSQNDYWGTKLETAIICVFSHQYFCLRATPG